MIKALEVYFKLNDMTDLTAHLTLDDATPGKVVDIVPSHGRVHLLATRAAIACIEPRCEEWTAPRDCRPAKLSVTTCRCLVMITNVLAPKLVIPNIKSSLGERMTLGDFGDTPFQKGIPLKMIKLHINLESIHTTAFADHTNNLADHNANNQAKQIPTSVPADQNFGEVSGGGGDDSDSSQDKE